MAINLTYGPIQAALQLAQQGGQGQNFWQRFAAEQQLKQGINEQARNVLASRQLGLQERQGDISTALAYDRLRSQERLAQEQLAQRQTEFSADQLYRGANLAMNQQGQQIAERRQGLVEQNEASRMAEQAAFAERFGMSPTEFEAALKQRQVAAQEARVGDFKGTETAKRLQARIKNAEKEVEAARVGLSAYTDKLSSQFSEAKAWPGAEDDFKRAKAYLEMKDAALAQLRGAYDAALVGSATTGVMTPEAQAAAQAVIASGGVAAGQPTMDDVTGMAKSIFSSMPATLPEADVRGHVAGVLSAFNGVTPEYVDAVTEEVLKLRG